jgi:hypothetical protein
VIDQLGPPIPPTSLTKGAPVVSGQGDAVGSVHVVLLEGDSLDGLVIDRSVDPTGLAVVEPEEVKGLFERGVVLGLSTMQCEFLPRPEPGADGVDDAERTQSASRAGTGGVLRRAWSAVTGH